MSSQNLPIPTSPEQTLATLGTKPHCDSCALYALRRSQLPRRPCRTCATKAHIDSPLLLIHLFGEFEALSRAIRGLQHRETDLTRLVTEDFEQRLGALGGALEAHRSDPSRHYLDNDRQSHDYLGERLHKIEKELDRLRNS